MHNPTVWAGRGELFLLARQVGQGQAETLEAIPPQPVKVMEREARSFESAAGD